MKITPYLFIPMFIFGAAALPAQVLLDDNFTSGTSGVFQTVGNAGIGVQNLPSSAEWFSQGSSTVAPNATYINGTGILNSGASASDAETAYFESPGNYATLSVGSTLTLTVDFNMMSALPPDSASAIRLGLFNSGATATNGHQTTVDTGTTTTTTSTYSPKNYTGYYAEFNPMDHGTDVASLINYRPVGANTNWIGSNTGSTVIGGNAILAASLANWATDTYQAMLTLDYTSATTMAITFDIFDVSTGDTEVTNYLIKTTTTSLVTAFDGLTIGGGDGTAGSEPFTITGVNLTEVPEPSAYAAILAAATLGFVACRRRRQLLPR
jgi:hypothetical protein